EHRDRDGHDRDHHHQFDEREARLHQLVLESSAHGETIVSGLAVSERRATAHALKSAAKHRQIGGRSPAYRPGGGWLERVRLQVCAEKRVLWPQTPFGLNHLPFGLSLS